MACTVANVIKITNIVAAALLAIVWAWRWIYYMANYFYFWDIFTPLFIIFFAVLLVLCEFKKEFCKKYFGFIYELVGRGLWNFFLGSITMYGWGGHKTAIATICYVCGITLWILGIFFIIFHFTADKCGKADVKKDIETGEVKK
mmetsp:Transcript_8880/g.780  ORF Transcript_8880/g.780 Transcript_8880/m.780 type:complete len:144 (+) Transcript_8880:47-478(+)